MRNLGPFIAILAALWLTACDCGGEPAPADGSTPSDGGPRSLEDCGNAVDDDLDGLTDCDDPECSAPPLDPSGASSFYDSVRFLIDDSAAACAGGTATQAGASGIVPSEAAVITGFVEREDGSGLGGVRISAVGREEFGSTLSAADGRFFMVVNAGALVIRFELAGRLPAQRSFAVPRGQFTWAGRVVLVPRDARVTEISLDRDQVQIARASAMSDGDGTRTATLLVPPGTGARLHMADGSTMSPSSLHVRLTEFTVGARGEERMPGTLPPESGYTYAVEVDTDEGVEAGAASVEFDRPVSFYVENFLDFPIGQRVPLGYYDREAGRWEGASDGRVIEIIGVVDGVAQVDLDGDGAADSASALARAGFDDDERRALGSTYAARTELWRAEIEHLTPWDCNWPYGPPLGALAPDLELAVDTNPPRPCEWTGSIVGCEGQTLGEAIPIAGTSTALHYDSGRVPARADAYRVSVPLGEPGVPAGVLGVDIEIDVAGQHVEASEELDPDGRWTWDWDGRDVFGRVVPGITRARVRVGYRYAGEYQEPSASGSSFGATGGAFITGNRTRNEVTLWREHFVALGVDDPRAVGLGGWMLSSHHRFNADALVLSRGDGSFVDYFDRVAPASVVAGSPVVQGVSGDGGQARDARFLQTTSIAVGSDGTLYVADALAHRVRAIDPVGVIRTFAGTGVNGSSGDGGAARFADVANPTSIAFGTDGTLYIASGSQHCIRQVNRSGGISTFAGRCGAGGLPTGDGGPALSAGLALPGALAVDPRSGDVCFSDGLFGTVRCISTATGIIEQIAGGGAQSPDNALARQADLIGITSLAIDEDGRIYAALPGKNRVFVIAAGRVSTFAGTGAERAFEGGTATALGSSLYAPFDVEIDEAGDVCIAEAGGNQIVCVDTRQVMRHRAGGRGTFADGEPATRIPLLRPTGVAFGPEGRMYIAQGAELGAFVLGVDPGWPRLVRGEWWVPSEDGLVLDRFTRAGRHLATHSVVTGRELLSFDYDAEGRVDSITDADGNILSIARSTSGATITAPFGQRTTLEIGADGWLRRVIDPLSRSWVLTYYSADAQERSGLLHTFEAPGVEASTFTYDELGRITLDEGAEGSSLALERSFDGLAEAVSVTTAEGRVTTHRSDRDSAGAPRTTVAYPNGTSLEIARADREGAGDVVFTLSDGTALALSSTPHPIFGRAAPMASSATITLPSGATYTETRSLDIDFDALAMPPVIRGASWSQTSPLGTSSAAWDAAARTLTVTSVEGRITTLEYDTAGRLSWVRPPGLHPVQYVYDAIGRLSDVRRGNAAELRRVHLTYALDGYLDVLTAPDDAAIDLATDDVGRLTDIVGRGRAMHFRYDDVLHEFSVTDPSGGEQTLAFDDRGRLSEYRAPSTSTLAWAYDLDGLPQRASVEGTRHEVELVLDPATGRATRIASATDAIVPTYDPTSGYVRSVAGPGDVTVAFERDGPRTELQRWTGPIASTVDYAYDATGRLSSLRVGTSASVTYGWDRDGLLTSAGPLTLTRSPTSGLLESISAGVTSTTHRLDAFGDLAELTTTWPASGRFGQVVTRRDARGRVLELSETSGAVTTSYRYVYDASDRLYQVYRDATLVEQYAYDASGNRTTWTNGAGSFSASEDAEGRVAAFGAVSLTFNDYGQRLTSMRSAARTTYTYDDFGNLRSVALPDGRAIAYEVDAYGRRVGKRVDGALARGWVYLDALRPIGEFAPDGSVRAVFVYASRRHVPDLIRTSSATYRVVTDQLGSVRRIVDVASGAVAQAIDYDAFGRVVRDTAPGFQPFGFAGGLYDPDTGLVRFGARDYDAEVGQWTARDPIHLFSGDTNLYAYAANDPVNGIDPSGLYVESAIDIASIGYDVYALARDNVFGSCDNLGSNLLALGLDVVGLALPFVTGLGAISHGAGAIAHADDAARLAGAGEDVVYHYTTANAGARIQATGLFTQSSATNVGTYTAQEAVELLGVKPPVEVVVEIRNAGQFVSNSPAIVQPHPLGPGGGLDLTNPRRVPADCILCVRPVRTP